MRTILGSTLHLLCKKLDLFNFLSIFSIALLTFLLSSHGARNDDLKREVKIVNYNSCIPSSVLGIDVKPHPGAFLSKE